RRPPQGDERRRQRPAAAHVRPRRQPVRPGPALVAGRQAADVPARAGSAQAGVGDERRRFERTRHPARQPHAAATARLAGNPLTLPRDVIDEIELELATARATIAGGRARVAALEELHELALLLASLHGRPTTVRDLLNAAP